MKIYLAVPPLLQFNNPYPSTAYLTGYLESRGYQVEQRDLSLELVLRILSRVGLQRVAKAMKRSAKHPSVVFFNEAQDDYLRVIDPVIQFLQGHNPSLGARMASRTLLPEGPRFVDLATDEILKASFGRMGVTDQAKFLASLFIDDICDVIREGVDPDFGLSRYAERLSSCQPTLTPILKRLNSPETLIDGMLTELTEEEMSRAHPDVVGLSVPFPGNLYGALRVAKVVRQVAPRARIVMGGGFVNTELRSLTDPRFFDFVDDLIFDDGERPLECLLENLRASRKIGPISGGPAREVKTPKQVAVPSQGLLRTMRRVEGRVVKLSDSALRDLNFKDHPGPSFRGLDFSRYISMFEMLNPAHRLWSDFKWNKMILAHGCYWHKCTFCDTNLDYIGRYEPDRAVSIVDKMQRVAAETGQTGFHFVDEAAPPALLKALSLEILRRGFVCTWWSNIRFEKTFDSELADLMADAGCIAVTGGIEVASDRLLALINKGVTIEQVARVTKAFSNSRILVHAYLMYGFPSQTVQETVDSLEVVRQLFIEGCLTSAYWHRFAATLHSPVGKNPEKFGIELIPLVGVDEAEHGRFATNDVGFRDPVECPHDQLGKGLHLALYNYMHKNGLDADVREWFDWEVPKTKISKTRIKKALRDVPG